MSAFFMLLSYLGIIQALILAAIYFKGYGKHTKNEGIGWLFLLFAAAMTVIVLSNTMDSGFHELLEVIEYFLTLLAGPTLYVAVKGLRGEYDSSNQLTIHFAPAVLYPCLAIGLWATNSSLMVPILIPVLHMQAYSAWFLITSWQNRLGRSGWGWLELLSLIVIFLHAAQWIRMAAPNTEYFEFIVPVTGFAVFYGLMIYGFVSPFLNLTKGRPYHTFESNEWMEQLKILERKMNEKKLYKHHGLTLDQLAKEVEIPSHVISHIINNGLNKNFNEWINQYRVNLVKEMLNDASQQHFTIDAMAEEAGFNSRSSFYNAFKKLTGTTPSQYQKTA